MAHIAITGAGGDVGRVALDAFDEETHEVTPITRSDKEGIESVRIDVTNRDAFVENLPEDVDVLIHLAAEPSPYADWDDVREVNVDGVYNAYHAAVENDVDRVVYASSNHALNADDVAAPDEPETLRENAPVSYPDDEPHPDSFYGVTKVAGEALGKQFARREGLEVVNLRIGWLMSREDLRENVADPPTDDEHTAAGARFARAMWLSPRDCRDVVRASSLSDLPENPLTVHAVSANDERCLSLTSTLTSIGYAPRDNAAAVVESD